MLKLHEFIAKVIMIIPEATNCYHVIGPRVSWANFSLISKAQIWCAQECGLRTALSLQAYMENEKLVDHIVELVEKKAAELEATRGKKAPATAAE